MLEDKCIEAEGRKLVHVGVVVLVTDVHLADALSLHQNQPGVRHREVEVVIVVVVEVVVEVF